MILTKAECREFEEWVDTGTSLSIETERRMLETIRELRAALLALWQATDRVPPWGLDEACDRAFALLTVGMEKP